jgi:hypothetical protein
MKDLLTTTLDGAAGYEYHRNWRERAQRSADLATLKRELLDNEREQQNADDTDE